MDGWGRRGSGVLVAGVHEEDTVVRARAARRETSLGEDCALTKAAVGSATGAGGRECRRVE